MSDKKYSFSITLGPMSEAGRFVRTFISIMFICVAIDLITGGTMPVSLGLLMIFGLVISVIGIIGITVMKLRMAASDEDDVPDGVIKFFTVPTTDE